MKKILLALFVVLALSSSLEANSKAKQSEQSRYKSLAKLTKVIGTVEKYYVDDLTLDKIVSKSLKGLMEELDAHSSYMDKSEFKAMNVLTRGEFGGLGITVGMKDGVLTVISPIYGTPAQKADVKAGDIILKINSKSTLNMSLGDAVSLMRGKVNTSIKLVLIRKDMQKPIVKIIKRKIIKIKSVYAKTIDNQKILYIRITSFDQKVVRGLKKALKSHRNIQGIVLDLRNNPGGLLNQAIGTVDLFVKHGVIVSQKGRIKQNNKKFYAHYMGTLSSKPMVVLVNGGSASASEIVSGALQDHKRAVIVGTRTFGKGSVQVILPINDAKTEAIRLTIARYYLPSGRTIQAKGIIPDVLSYAGLAVKARDSEFLLRESELKKHLTVKLDKFDKKTHGRKHKHIKKSSTITQAQLLDDNQLNTGVNILKSLIRVSK